jgi:O-antigen/teichoic acid export membrane protein
MSNVRNIAKNFIALSVAQIISIGLSLVLVILITRFIGIFLLAKPMQIKQRVG